MGAFSTRKRDGPTACLRGKGGETTVKTNGWEPRSVWRLKKRRQASTRCCKGGGGKQFFKQEERGKKVFCSRRKKGE